MKRTFTIARGFKALLLAGGATTFTLATPAFAQNADQSSSADQAASSGNADTIVVTGSRIARKDYTNNSPTVTVGEDLLTQSSTAAIEANLNKLPQFVPTQTPTTEGGDIQPTATNTAGAATISLRGIGSNRNLVLIDGRRATPSNASGVVDINTIPSAAIERVEVISGGASATYGADAVAGVTNFILKKNFKGLELDGQMGLSEHGDGFEYQLSGIAGTNFADGRGNVTVAISMNQRNPSYQRDRSWYRDLWADPSIGGSGLFPRAGGVAFDPSNPFSEAAGNTVFPGATPEVPGSSTVYVNPDGTLFSGADLNGAFGARGGAKFFEGDLSKGRPYKLTQAGTIGENDDYYYLVFPLTRYNMFMRSNYKINDWIGVFGQGMFSHTHTHTQGEPGPIVNGWAASIPHGDYTYADSLLTDGSTNPAYMTGGQYGLNCGPVGGCTASQVFPVSSDLGTLLDSRANPNANFNLNALMPDLRQTDTDVSTYNLIGGFEGSIPGTDWTWEAYVNHGMSETFSNQTGVYSLERTRAVLDSPNYGRGFSQTGNPDYAGFGASTGTCTSGLDFLNPPEGGFSQDCLDAIGADLKNRTKLTQTIAEANAQGKLLDLPAGELRAAIGASYRNEDFSFLNDTLTTQGRSFQDQALGIYPSANSFGSFDVREVYGELLVPLLHDIPAIQNFSLELGGRISDYSTTGTSYTYKALGDWQVNDWLRFRGGYNRAERAPNIGELYLAPQETFGVNPIGDVCSTGNPATFSANPATNASNAANVKAMCQIMMNQHDPSGNSAINFYGRGNPGDPGYVPASPGSTTTATFGFAWPTIVGNPNLTPEKADTWTAGAVISSPFSSPLLSRLRLTVDWWDIKVKDAIGLQSVATSQQQCFDPAFNPSAATDPAAAVASPLCQTITRNIPGGDLGNVDITYGNTGRFNVSGIDATLDWATDAGPGTLAVNVNASYLLHFKSAALPSQPEIDYAGTFGTGDNGLNGGAYRWRTFTTVSYRVQGASLSLQWQHLPSIEDAAEAQLGIDTPTTGAPAYDLFSLNGTYDVFKNVTLRFGVDNLFNKAPPLTQVNTTADPVNTGVLPGGSYNSAYYDILGRRFFFGAKVKF